MALYSVTGIFVRDDGHVTEFQMFHFIGAQPRIGHEEHEIVQLLCVPFVAAGFRAGRVLSCGFVELFIFVRREPWPMFDLALPPVGI
tara:strand:+ start:2806 stop:3066 length:261 start_codon:yes stop_codon:yes gene_type:complete